MIDHVIRFSIRNKLLIGLLIAALIGWGTYSVVHLPLDAVPDITDNQVQVITNSPTLAAQEVEKLITYPLELTLGNIPGVIEIRSVSRFGLSLITIVFRDEMDIYLARQLIGERLLGVDIPQGLGQPEMGPITTGLGEIYQYVLYAQSGYEDEFDAMELRSLQDWVVKRQLIGIEGVIEVNSSGGFLKQYEVSVDPDKLKSMNVTLPELVEAVEMNNANAGGSYIEKRHYTYFIRGEGRLEDASEIGNIIVKQQDGLPILLSDVATVEIGHAPRFGAVTMNGIGEVVSGQVMMLKGANAAEVTDRVKERIEQIRKSLPEGVVMEPYLDRSKLVNRTTRTVVTNLVEGGLIVIFILVLMLGNLRAGLIVASVIPLSMLFAVGMMGVFGVSANLMSLGAIDFGLIVDGALIIVESILHHLGLRRRGQRLSTGEMDEEVGLAATRIRRSAAFGEVIILIVYLPILFLSGIEGKMFKPMAQTVSFAIIGALLLSLTYVPMMAALLLKRDVGEQRGLATKIMAFLHSVYEPFLRSAMKVKTVLILLTMLLFGWSLWLFSNMGGEFIPTLEEGDFALHQILPPGSSLAQGVDISDDLQRILLDHFPEVEKVVTKIGTAEIPTDVMPLEAGDIYVILKPKAEWTSAKTKEEMFEKMEVELNKFPGVIYEFTQPIQMRFNELMTGVRQDIAVKIYGEDLGLLVKYANNAKEIVEQIDGVGDIQVEPTAGLQQIIADYDRSKLAKYGISVETLNRTIRTGFAGAPAGYIFEGEQRYGLVVRLNEEFRQSIDNVADLYVPLPGGGQVPLSEVADVRFEEGPTQVSRDNTQRRITIGVNARGRDVESLVEHIQDELEKKLSLPPGYYLTFGGQFENLQKARASLLVAVPVALGLIFVLLYLTFQSFWQALLIFTAIPMSAIGGIWALYFRGMPFSISAGVGFIALFGVAVLNGIVLIGYFNRLKQEGMTDVLQRIFEGTKVRLRPVLLTAMVASLGFLPMAFSQSAGAEVQQPLATVVIGGLITATFLTLFVLPALYYFSEKRRDTAVRSGLVVVLLGVGMPSAVGQSPAIGLEEAVRMAKTNYPSLITSRGKVDQAERLLGTRSNHPMASVFISGDEFNFDGVSGLQSLGMAQSFNLPKVGRSQRSYYQQTYELARRQVDLDENTVEWSVRKAYFESVYLKQRSIEMGALAELYREMEDVANIRQQAGEGGRLPIVAARTRQKEVDAMNQEVTVNYQIAVATLNWWLASDTLYLVELEALPPPLPLRALPIDQHPQVLLADQQTQVAMTQVEVQKSRLLPQIATQFRLQSLQGKTLFYGYQMGLNLPLFKGAQKQRIEAAEVAVQVGKDQRDAVRYQLDRKRDMGRQQLEGIEQQLAFHREELIPQAEEQVTLSRIGWRNGEASYLDYANSVQLLIQYKLKYLELLRNHHLLRIQTDFLYSF